MTRKALRPAKAWGLYDRRGVLVDAGLYKGDVMTEANFYARPRIIRVEVRPVKAKRRKAK